MAIIRASEVGEYVYCARAWWLRRVAGWQPSQQQRRDLGVLRHARHARTVALSRGLLLLACGVALLAVVLLVT